jgi:hypothetical protein
MIDKETPGTVRGSWAAWKEFDWIPTDLISQWIVLISAMHDNKAMTDHKNVAQVLWDKDTMVFAGLHKGTMEMLRGATKSWLPSKRREYGTYLLALQLAIEILGCNFAEWGTAYPDAKRRADELLEKFFTHSRTRLLDFYMPKRAQLDQKELRESFGPAGAAVLLKEGLKRV